MGKEPWLTKIEKVVFSTIFIIAALYTAFYVLREHYSTQTLEGIVSYYDPEATYEIHDLGGCHTLDPDFLSSYLSSDTWPGEDIPPEGKLVMTDRSYGKYINKPLMPLTTLSRGHSATIIYPDKRFIKRPVLFAQYVFDHYLMDVFVKTHWRYNSTAEVFYGILGDRRIIEIRRPPGSPAKTNKRKIKLLENLADYFDKRMDEADHRSHRSPSSFSP